MQLGRARPTSEAGDLATALRTAAEQLGHRPAVTVLRDDGEGVVREEQGFAGLAQWAAKGAHLLELDLLAEPGDGLALVGPPGWLPVAATLAAWWSGLVVTDDAASALVLLAHEDVDIAAVAVGPDTEVLRWGWAVDGAPLGDVDGEAWSSAVQAFPDAPPPARATPNLPALRSGDGRVLDQAAILATARALAEPPAAAMGLHADLDGTPVPDLGWLAPGAALPLVSGRATVLVDRRLPRGAADGERVSTWYVRDTTSP